MTNPVTNFEMRFADKIGTSYAIAVNSGTSALHSALVACDVEGGEVVMPALCPAMDAFAIIHAGARPVFADVDPKTQLVTRESLEPCLNKNTRAIIAVSLHGLPVDMDPMLPLGIPVIEDCAQALLAKYKGRYAGTAAHIGCFSFEKKKHLTTGSEGGAIITNDPMLAERARKFSGIGYKHMTAEAGRTSLSAEIYQNPDYERFDTIGLNYRMCEAQAEIGLTKLKTIDAVVQQRQEIGLLWQQAIHQQCQPHSYDAENAFYSAAFEYPGEDWNQFYGEFVKRGGDGFYAMPKCPYHEPALLNLEAPWCPFAENFQKQLMLYKTHYSIREAMHQTRIMSEMIHEYA